MPKYTIVTYVSFFYSILIIYKIILFQFLLYPIFFSNIYFYSYVIYQIHTKFLFFKVPFIPFWLVNRARDLSGWGCLTIFRWLAHVIKHNIQCNDTMQNYAPLQIINEKIFFMNNIQTKSAVY